MFCGITGANMEKNAKGEGFVIDEHGQERGTRINKRFIILGVVIVVLIIIGASVGTIIVVSNKDSGNKGESKTKKSSGCESFARPALILVYTDGFRSDYLKRGFSPTINKLAKTGVHAKAMRSQFPTKSFPNLYSIATTYEAKPEWTGAKFERAKVWATNLRKSKRRNDEAATSPQADKGLYPESHGIVANYFLSKSRNETFAYWFPTMKEGKWWQGEPIWLTAKRQGVKSAVYYFWSEHIKKENQPDYWIPYDNGNATYSSRVDQILSWLDLEPSKRPYFLSMYVANPDNQGHDFGPESPQTNAGIKTVDDMILRLVSGIKDRQLDECTNVIIVSDHGMSNISCSKSLYLDKLINIDNITVTGTGPFVSLYTKSKADTTRFIDELKCKSSKFRAYSRDGNYIPKRYHYHNNKRIGDIILVPEIGWTVYAKSGSCQNQARGQHGYDNMDPLMSALFVANGPSFKKGVVADEFLNTELYNLMAEILQITPAPNNGTTGKLSYLLKKPMKSTKPAFKGDGNNYSMDCKFPKNIIEALKNCSACTCPYCSSTIKKNLTAYRQHLDLSTTEIKSTLNQHLPWGIPQGGAGKQGCVLPQRHYITGYSGYLHIPLWVAYKMTAKQLSTNLPRKNCFRRDIRLSDRHSSFCVNYYRSGYDRGHMAPSGDFNFDRFAEQDTYVLSNIAPQSRYFNRNPGLWYKAESLFREWTFLYKSVYVMSGSIFDADNDGLRDNDNQTKRWTKNQKGGVAIPTHFYKIIIRCIKNDTLSYNISGCNGGSLEALSFVFPHNEERSCRLYDWKKQLLLYTATINDIEKLTGSNLFPSLPEDFAIQFKMKLPSKLWEIPT